ncbi:MAG: O-antigen ligase family protein, partial [Candidatus Acidiferrales bacterium]
MLEGESPTMTAIRVGICSLLAFAVLTDGGVPDWSTAVLEIGAALLFVLWGFVTARQRQIDVRPNWLYLPVLGLIALCLTQKLFGLSVYPYATKIELLKWIAYFALAFLAVETFRTPEQSNRFAVFLLSFGFVVALFAIAQHYIFNGKLYWFVPLPQSSEPFGPFVDRDTFRIFRNHYTTGTGLGTLETVFPQYETTYTGRVVDHAHNDYLELLAETGVIGGLLGLAFIVLLFRQGFANLNARERQSDRVFYAGALAA